MLAKVLQQAAPNSLAPLPAQWLIMQSHGDAGPDLGLLFNLLYMQLMTQPLTCGHVSRQTFNNSSHLAQGQAADGRINVAGPV